MIREIKRFGEKDYPVIKCNNHQPWRVTYNFYSKFGDVWKVFYGGYVLGYFDGGTSFEKISKNATKPTDYYQSIKKFDHELKIKPKILTKSFQHY